MIHTHNRPGNLSRFPDFCCARGALSYPIVFTLQCILHFQQLNSLIDIECLLFSFIINLVIQLSYLACLLVKHATFCSIWSLRCNKGRYETSIIFLHTAVVKSSAIHIDTEITEISDNSQQLKLDNIEHQRYDWFPRTFDHSISPVTKLSYPWNMLLVN